MTVGHRHMARALAAWMLCAAAQVAPAQGQIGSIHSSGEVLSGQSSSIFSSTTIVSQGDIFLGAQDTATMVVGFNVNADASPGLVAIETGIASFDLRFTLDHPGSFDLVFDFLLRGEVLRVEDQDCQGAMTLGDVSIPTLERLGLNPAQFPLDVVLPGASVDLGSDTQGIKLAEQRDRTLQFRGQPVETTAYRMSFQVSATALSQSCEVSARFGADNGSTTECSACEYPGFEDRVRDDDGLFVTVTVVSLCGNGSFDAGEECDQGTNNGVDGSCCDRFCRLAPATVICRPSAADCDEDETCTGLSAICPEDLPKLEGSPCTADRSPCTDDVCGAGGVCEHPPSAGATCADGLCTCDNDGLFCNGLVQCGTSLCIVLPPPCGEDDTCDEDRNICISPFGTATPTATPSADTPTPTAVTPGAATPTATAGAAICAGDCNGDRQVVVNELVLGVNVALGNQPASACAAFDSNRDGSVVINELVAGVSSALSGCRP